MKKLMTIALALALLSPTAWANCGNENGHGNGCSGEEEQGPPGPVGPQGGRGDTGSRGADGIAGRDGQAPTGLNDARMVADVAVRLYDGKRLQLQAFNAFALGSRPNQDILGNGQNFMYGLRLVIKLGRSYEERRMAEMRARIERLERSANGR